jgi:trans-aconitate 2-methyltransferase
MSTENIHWNTDLYKDKHHFVFKYGEDLVSLLDPKPGEKILDLGCGTGELTEVIAQKGAEAIGLDYSIQMIVQARKSFPALNFIQENGLHYDSPQSFDAIFSNAVLHWITPPELMVERIAQNLKKGGRFVAEFGGKGNTKTMINALKNSLRSEGFIKNSETNFWFFPSIAEYATMLEKEGLEVKYSTLFDRPTKLNDGKLGLKNWFLMFGEHFFKGMSQEEINKVLIGTEKALVDKLFHDGSWIADYKRIRIIAYKS